MPLSTFFSFPNITSDGIFAASIETMLLPNQPSLKSNEDDVHSSTSDSSWRQLDQIASVDKEEMLRMQSSSKSVSSFAEDCEERGDTPFTAAEVAAGKDEKEAVVATPKNKLSVDVAVMVDSGTVDTADLTTTPSAVVDDDGCEGAVEKRDSPGEVRQAPSSLSHTSSLSNSPTDEHHQDVAPRRSSICNDDNVVDAVHEYSPPPPQGLGPYHRPGIMMQHPNHSLSLHSLSQHHRSAYHPSHYGALPTHPPPHLHPSRLSGAGGTGGGYAAVEGLDENSPSASTISTKASLAPNRFFKDYDPTPDVVSRHRFPSDRKLAAPREGGSYEASPHRMMHARHLLSLSSDKNNEQLQQSIPTHKLKYPISVKKTRESRVGSNDYSVDGCFSVGKEGDGTSLIPPRSPTVTLDECVMARPLATDGRIMAESPAAASTEASSSHHSQQSLELGAMQSWETAGKPLAGWSVCSGNTFSGIVEGLKDGAFASAFSFSESSDPVKDGSGNGGISFNKNKDKMLNVDKEEDDPSPKSILSKSGEKRKVAPGTHVQFSKDFCDGGLENANSMALASSAGGAWTESRKRSRGMVVARSPSSTMPHSHPPPPQHHLHEYYHEDDPPRHAIYPYDQYRHPPPPHPSHRLPHDYRNFTEEDPYYDYYYGPPPPPLSPYGYPPHSRKHPSRHPHHRLEYPPPPPYHHAMPSQRPYPSGGGRGTNIYTVHTPSQAASIHHHPPVNARLSHNSIAPVAAKMYNKDPSFEGWSKDDDDALMDLMRKVKSPKSWVPIAKKFDRGKSEWEIQDRWTRYLKPGSRKGQWTDEEDAVVVETVQNSMEEPFTRWSDLAQRLPGRVGKQVRDRWVNHLNPAINHLPFSREDVSICLMIRFHSSEFFSHRSFFVVIFGNDKRIYYSGMGIKYSGSDGWKLAPNFSMALVQKTILRIE